MDFLDFVYDLYPLRFGAIYELSVLDESVKFVFDKSILESVSDKTIKEEKYEKKERVFMKFRLGDVLRDRVTKFEDVAMVRSEYYTGGVSYGLCSAKLREGRPLELEYFSEIQLDRVGSLRVEIFPDQDLSDLHFETP